MSFQWSDYSILIVEDDKNMLEILREVFQAKGSKVSIACNGQQGLEELAKVRVDFVISDVQMPMMGGVELLKAIRKINPDIPLVLLATGHAQITESEAVGLGAIGLIYKPFNIGKLRATVQKFLEEKYAKRIDS